MPCGRELGQIDGVKCHGYICVKIFASWGKNFGRARNFVNLSIFLKDFHNLCKISIDKIAQFDRVVNISSPNKSFSTVLCDKITKIVAI